MSKNLFVVFALCSAVGLASCEKASEKAAESVVEEAARREGGNVTADFSKGKVTLKTDEGEVTISEGGKAAIPEGFPSDVLVYKGAAVVMTSRQGDGFIANLTTSDDAKTVVQAYTESMSAKAWKQASVMDFGGQKTLVYEKDKKTAVIMVGSDEDQTVINITVEVPKE